MKTVLLMRHAKSSWKEAGLTDWARPLNRRGRRDAPRMGELLLDEDLVPQAILSSAARRARETAEAVAEAMGYDGDIAYLDELYGAMASEYLGVLSRLPDDVDVALVIGHNPELQYLVEVLTGETEHLPTAAIAQIRMPVERWADVEDDLEAELVMVWRPPELT
jgi:phosphohistidine phosphatase